MAILNQTQHRSWVIEFGDIDCEMSGILPRAQQDGSDGDVRSGDLML